MLAIDDDHYDNIFKSLTFLTRSDFIPLDALSKYDSVP